jgi:hypothetical protein
MTNQFFDYQMADGPIFENCEIRKDLTSISKRNGKHDNYVLYNAVYTYLF